MVCLTSWAVSFKSQKVEQSPATLTNRVANSYHCLALAGNATTFGLECSTGSGLQQVRCSSMHYGAAGLTRLCPLCKHGVLRHVKPLLFHTPAPAQTHPHSPHSLPGLLQSSQNPLICTPALSTLRPAFWVCCWGVLLWEALCMWWDPVVNNHCRLLQPLSHLCSQNRKYQPQPPQSSPCQAGQLQATTTSSDSGWLTD